MLYKINYSHINGVDVFLERYQIRIFVGRLTRHKTRYLFAYNEQYLKLENVIPLGVEFPLTQQQFESDHLFESFKDRLPDPDNTAYQDYCDMVGIDKDTTDPLILLATIGKRGPSSFIFEPYIDTDFTFDMCEQWRKELKFSIKDFADFFGISASILQKIKAKKSSGIEILNRLKLYWLYEQNFQHQLNENSKWLHPKKIQSAYDWMNHKFNDDTMRHMTEESIARLIESENEDDIILALSFILKFGKDQKKIFQLLPRIKKNVSEKIIHSIVDIVFNFMPRHHKDPQSKILITEDIVLSLYDFLIRIPFIKSDNRDINIIEILNRMYYQYPDLSVAYVLKRADYLLNDHANYIIDAPYGISLGNGLILPDCEFCVYDGKIGEKIKCIDAMSDAIFCHEQSKLKIYQWISENKDKGYRYIRIKQELLTILKEDCNFTAEEKEILETEDTRMGQYFLKFRRVHLQYIKKILLDEEKLFIPERMALILIASEIDAMADFYYKTEEKENISTKTNFIKLLIEETGDDQFGAIHPKKMKDIIEKKFKENQKYPEIKAFLDTLTENKFLLQADFDNELNNFFSENNLQQNVQEPIKKFMKKHWMHATYAGHAYDLRCEVVHTLEGYEKNPKEDGEHKWKFNNEEMPCINAQFLTKAYEKILQKLEGMDKNAFQKKYNDRYKLYL